MNKTFIIYKKELKEIFKDKKTIFMTLFFPIILYPLLIAISSLLAIKGQDKVDKTINVIAIEKNLDNELTNQIKKDKKFKVVEVKDYKGSIENKEIDMYLSYNSIEKEFFIYYNSTKDESKSAVDKVTKYLEQYKDKKQKLILKQKGISEEFLEVYNIKENNLASKEKMTNQILGIALPLIILFPLLGSIMFSALDLTSGEKERKTIETLFILPVKNEEIMLAKLFAVISMGIFSAGINFLGMFTTFLIAKNLIPQINEFLGNGLDYSLIIKCFIMTIPLIFMISGVGLIVGLLSKDYKEAQNYLTPVYLIFMLPIYFLTSPGWKLEGIMSYIPVLNVFLFFKELGLGNVSALQMFMVFLINISFAVIVLIVFGKLFNSETILFIDEKGFNFSWKRLKFLEKKGLEVSEIFLYYFVIMIVLVTAGGILQLKMGITGVFLTQILIIVMPVILVIRFLNIDYKNIFPVKKVSSIEIFNSISFWLIGLVIIAVLSSIQLKLFPSQMKDLEGLAEFLKDTKLWQQILVFSVTPAICEEILFRGLLFGSLKEKMDVKYAIIVSGLLFGIFHLYPGKILSTALLGMIFAYVVARTGSIIPSMILHFINNFFSLVIAGNLPKYQNNIMVLSVASLLAIILCMNGIRWFLVGLKKKNFEDELFLK